MRARLPLSHHRSCSPDDWAARRYLQDKREFLEEKGLLEEGSNKNVWAVATELYRKAAESDLHGGQEKAILCWGVAANMCRVGPHRDDKGGASYSVGDLRAAIAKAREAARERDVELFGEDPDANGTYVAQVLLLLLLVDPMMPPPPPFSPLS